MLWVLLCFLCLRTWSFDDEMGLRWAASMWESLHAFLRLGCSSRLATVDSGILLVLGSSSCLLEEFGVIKKDNDRAVGCS